MNDKRQNRSAGIELLRIVSMLMIIIVHILGQGGIIGNTKYPAANNQVAWLLEIACYCCVNCYGLITGYVSVDRELKYKTLFKTWLQVIFYTVGITLIFTTINKIPLTITHILDMLFPVSRNAYWYFTAFFGLMIFAPFLNKLLNNISKKDYQFLISATVVLFTILPIFGRRGDFNTNYGYSMIWLIALYIIGGYLKTYPIKIFSKKRIWLFIYFASILITWGSFMLVGYLTLKKINTYGLSLVKYNSPTILLSGTSLFIFFSKLNVQKNTIRLIINFMSRTSFSVYLIHVNNFIWNNLMLDAFIDYAKFNPLLMTLKVVEFSIIIYLLCTLIDLVRILFFYLIELMINRIATKNLFISSKIAQRELAISLSKENEITYKDKTGE